MDTVKSEQRRSLRAKRLALSPRQQTAAALDLACRINAARFFRNSTCLAGYLPIGGEIDPRPLLRRALALGKRCYLPVLAFGDRLLFAPFSVDTRFCLNRFNIPEPVVPRASLVSARTLDLILLPLVGFDRHGNRLGMGGGFYDRSLAFLNLRQTWRRPRLVGLAHDFQQVDTLAVDAWDVPLHAVATDRALYIMD